MELQFKLKVLSEILDYKIDIGKWHAGLKEFDSLQENYSINPKQIFFNFFIDETTEDIFTKPIIEQLEIVFQILINQGYKIFVSDLNLEEKYTEVCKNFVEVFKNDAIRYLGDAKEDEIDIDIDIFLALHESKFSIVTDEQSLLYSLISGKPFISLFNNEELLEKIQLEDLFINQEDFNAGVLLEKIKYIEENNKGIKEHIANIFGVHGPDEYKTEEYEFEKHESELTNNYIPADNEDEFYNHDSQINNQAGSQKVPDKLNGNEPDGMEDYKKQFKENIKTLVGQGLLKEAKDALKQYEEIVKDDIDIYSIRGVIAMMEGDMDGAEKVLKEGLNMQSFNCDLVFNMAYLYEMQKKYIGAYRYYKRLKKITSKDSLKEINVKLKELEKIENVSEYKDRKKVLFIAHIFPPVGGSGVQRSLKFVKYLRDFGWEPVVVTVGNTKYPLRDETMVSEIPEEVEVMRIDERVNIDSAYANQLVQLYGGVVNDNALITEYVEELNKSQEHLSKLLLIPDIYILWATEVLDKIDDKVNFEEIDMIYTTSGPYSDHIIGYYLKQRYNKPWVADFRDEWTNNPYVNFDKNNIFYKISFSMEKNIVELADEVVTITSISKQNYEKIFELEFNKVHEITNGYDERDFSNLNIAKKDNDKFTIIHNGLLYMIRTPETFLMAVKNLILKGKVEKNKISIIFPWVDNKEQWEQYMVNNGLNDTVKITGYLNHKESLELAASSDLLLLIIGKGNENKAVYTGKVFEYLRLCKPILALSPKDSLVEKLLNRTDRGKNFEFDDVESMEGYILKIYQDWENNELETFSITDEITQFERKILTGKLSDIFAGLLEKQEYKEIDEKTKRIAITEKKRIVFFSTGGDKFIWDIINELSKEYETKKITITKTEELKLIDEWMEWADICWFEWCDELIIYGSQLPLARERKILCRLHRYEALTTNPLRVNWANVDKLIIVTNHLKNFLKAQISDIEEKVDIVTINNGVNLDKYKFKERRPGYNLAYVGYVHQRKNPILLLQIVKKLIEKNKKYKLYMAGKFQDVLIEAYWNYQVNKMNLERNIIFEGWQENIDEWLKNKNYLLSTSIHESFGYGIAEAMSRGLKPVIHDFIFSEEIWPKEYLFNTIDEAVNMITSEDYSSIEYRKFIEKNYSLDIQMGKIKQIIKLISKSVKKKNVYSRKPQFNYKEYWEERYKKGGNSGEGSYGKFAEFKAEIINGITDENSIKNVVEFGCGDGGTRGREQCCQVKKIYDIICPQ